MLDELSAGPQPHMYTYDWCKTVLNSDLLDDDAYVAIYQRYCYMYTSLQFMNFTRLVPSNLTYNVKRKASEIHHLKSDTVNDNSEEKVHCTCCTCYISRTSILSDLFVSHQERSPSNVRYCHSDDMNCLCFFLLQFFGILQSA